ncbi:SsgA family sporulation/cell division regulator [Kitasatospora sp. NPDC002965]|uniref:SsgA family sporulation/cell division regulator n=1 Tax=Kitasatospora sp. NPDC002965 TaxID=3154775 RepID=UPI00339E5276
MFRIIEDVVEACIIGPELRRVLLELRYDTGDPFAMSVGFGAEAALDPEGRLCWTAARELFGQGLSAPAGRGDLRVRPWQPGTVGVEFHGDDGWAILVLGADDLTAFLRRTWQAVPPGTEHLLIHWPDTVAELTGEPG